MLRLKWNMQRAACLLRLGATTTAPSQSRLVHHHRERGNIKQFLGLFKSRKSNKHFRHEWRTERARKTVNIVLPLDGPTMRKIQKAETADPVSKCTIEEHSEATSHRH